MRAVYYFQPVSEKIVQKIMEVSWVLIPEGIHVAFGCATVEKGCKAVWTNEGRRVEVSMGGGVYVFSVSKKVDPIYTARIIEVSASFVKPGEA